MQIKKGIILAGGTATRLKPLTSATSKHLLPVYNKPMIYYPLSTLMLGGIKEYLIITKQSDLHQYKLILGNGHQWGIDIKYKIQKKPGGLPEAFIIGESFINNEPVCLNLGDHIFFGSKVISSLKKNIINFNSNVIFSVKSNSPQNYGVLNFDKHNKVNKIEEKPKTPTSKNILCGLYLFDKNVVNYSKKLKKSSRNELEITDLINIYLKKNNLNVEVIKKNNIWFDAGTPENILRASIAISKYEEKNQIYSGSPEIAALYNKYIGLTKYKKLINLYKNNNYGNLLASFLKNN